MLTMSLLQIFVFVFNSLQQTGDISLVSDDATRAVKKPSRIFKAPEEAHTLAFFFSDKCPNFTYIFLFKCLFNIVS